jgi:hypothetical protein
MNRFYSLFAAPFVSITMIACGAMATGCIGSEEPESSTDAAEEALINESGPLSIPAQGSMLLQRTNEGESLSAAPGGSLKETAPGVWENENEDGASRIVVGVEGHTWAIEQAKKDLAELYERSSAQQDADPDAAVMKAIQQNEAHLKNLEETATAMASATANTPSAVSCNISFYTGPSSPITGSYGAAGLTQVSCSGGCQTFTISAQACTNYGCSPVGTSSSLVCASPWTFGMAKGGTYGAACSAASSISPPGITSSWSGTCG